MVAAVIDDHANPIGKRHLWPAQRLLQMAEFQVCVRVDQTRNKSHVA